MKGAFRRPVAVMGNCYIYIHQFLLRHQRNSSDFYPSDQINYYSILRFLAKLLGLVPVALCRICTKTYLLCHFVISLCRNQPFHSTKYKYRPDTQHLFLSFTQRSVSDTTIVIMEILLSKKMKPPPSDLSIKAIYRGTVSVVSASFWLKNGYNLLPANMSGAIAPLKRFSKMKSIPEIP